MLSVPGLISSCHNDETPETGHDSVFKQEMRAFVIGISQYSNFQRILNAGFDGVYLDCIDAFEYFE